MNTYVHDKTMTRGGQEGKGMNKEKREKRGGDKEETKRNNKSRGKIEDKQPKENVERERCR